MTDEVKTTQPQEQPQAATNEVDDEVGELLTDIVAMICNTDNVRVQYVRGDRSVNFIVDLREPKHRAMLIGKEGRTIGALRWVLRTIAGVNRRFYDIMLNEDCRPESTVHNVNRKAKD